MSTVKQLTLPAARNLSTVLGQAIEAYKMEQPVETWAEREQRLAEGRSHPTAWPIKLMPRQDDGLTIPERRALLQPYRPPVRKSLWSFDSVQINAQSFFMGMPLWQKICYILVIEAIFLAGVIAL